MRSINKFVVSALVFATLVSQPVWSMKQEEEGHFGQGVDYLSFLKVQPLHNKGIKGNGQTIVVLEDFPALNHPVINKDKTKIMYISAEGYEEEIENVKKTFKLHGEGKEHGNVVISLLNGRPKLIEMSYIDEEECVNISTSPPPITKTLTFYGGIAPEANVVCISDICHFKYDRVNETKNLYVNAVKKTIAEACKSGKIITSSVSFLSKEELQENGKLKSEIINFIQEQLISNDCAMILCICNYGEPINKDLRTQYLEDLSENSEIAKRLLIVGNLQDITQKN